jgi:hypothetical protein
VVDALAPGKYGVPFRKIVVRYLMMLAGLAPVFVVGIVYAVLYSADVEATAASHVFTWLRIAGFLTVVWFVVICVQVARKSDPLYDRIAGTAVVRDVPGKVDERVVATFE